MPQRRASATFVYVTIALDALAFGIVIPVEPGLVMKIGHIPESAASFWVGAVLAAFSTMQFLASPVLGSLSDRFGRRPVLLSSLAALGISAAVTPFAPSLFWLIVIRMVAGAMAGNAAAAQAYIADVTPPDGRTKRFGLVGALYGLGFVLGPAVGGVLGGLGIALPFLASAALAGCNVIYGLVALPESLPPERRRPMDWARANPVGTLAAVFVDAGSLRLGFAWCCSWFALGAQQSSFILANEMRFHWSTVQNGLVLALAGTASALTQGLLVQQFVQRVGPLRTALVGLGCCAAGYACYAFADTGWILFPGLLILALGALGNPALQSMMSGTVDKQRQGEVQGALTSLQGLMAIVSPLTMGWLFARTTAPGGSWHFIGSPFLLAAVVCVAGVVVLATLSARRVAQAEPGA